MSRVFIIGATGGIGSRLAPLLLGAGHSVTGLYRRAEQAEVLRQAGVSPVQGDLMQISSEDLEKLTRHHDVIVFSAGAAGSGPERTTTIDGEGPIKAVEAAKANGIDRLYLVSVFPDARRDAPRKEGFEHYIKAKRRADNAVAASGLDWVILRPGRLLDEPGNGRVLANRAIAYGSVSRDDVAATLAALIDTPEIRRDVIELTEGEMTVKEAVASLLR